MLQTDALQYDLPEELIASTPPEQREFARMMVLDSEGAIRAHSRVSDLPDLLPSGALLVFNDTRVLPARFVGRRVDTHGSVSGLYLHTGDHPTAATVMLKSNGRLRPGIQIELLDDAAHPTPFTIELIERREDQWLVRFAGCESALAAIDAIGKAPLPPYILRRREQQSDPGRDASDRDRYQTVFAREPGAVAAPTAGLHFTPALMEALLGRGIETAFVTLHVGHGTFKPVETSTVEEHPIHTEHFTVPADTLRALRDARSSQRPVIAVGTTTVRTLESLDEACLAADSTITSTTDLLITPGFEYHIVNGMLTNFHLPRSTLLALVAARIGLEALMAAYREAVARQYRFYSYGDCMLILPSR